MVVATTGLTDFSDSVADAFRDMEEELNDPTPLVRVEKLGLGDFHSAITADADGARIDITARIENWGFVTEPYEAYYGAVAAADVAAWYDGHGDRLFEQNLRKPLGNTPVNQGLGRTLDEEQAHFWYFNNGITGLCASLRRLPRGAASRNSGDFELNGVSIVNGAQTAAIARAANATNEEELLDAKVWVRFISLEGCPPEFASAVTAATNTQNTVERIDFVALDPEQARLRTELLLSEQKTYSIKRGEEQPPPEYGCTVSEATVALAYAQSRDPSLAVIAKSAVGRLWESTQRAPYKTLFNPQTSAFRLWRTVQAMREVDKQLEVRRSGLEGRDRAVAVQGNRIALHLVFRELDSTGIDAPDTQWEDQLSRIPIKTDEVLDLMIKHVEDEYGGNYITSLFKNAGRCERLVDLVVADLAVDPADGAAA